MTVKHLYKIVERSEWERAVTAGVFEGSADDRRDGFIHFSTAAQASGTALRHFAGRGGLLLVEIDAATLGPDLRWEASRGGDLFPHLYAPLPVSAETRRWPLSLGPDGRHLLPDDIG